MTSNEAALHALSVVPRIARPVGRSERLPERAIVQPDDTITFTDEQWAAIRPKKK